MTVRKESHSCTRNGVEVYWVTVFVDTEADIPNPADHPEWEVGSTLYVINTQTSMVLNHAGVFK